MKKREEISKVMDILIKKFGKYRQPLLEELQSSEKDLFKNEVPLNKRL